MRTVGLTFEKGKKAPKKPAQDAEAKKAEAVAKAEAEAKKAENGAS